MTMIREDVMEYAKSHGREQAADLLLFAGRDNYEGNDYDELLAELDGSAVRGAVYNALSGVMEKYPDTSLDEMKDAVQSFYDRFYDDYDEEEEYEETDRGLYSPSMPWNAPGMRVSDFI